MTTSADARLRRLLFIPRPDFVNKQAPFNNHSSFGLLPLSSTSSELTLPDDGSCSVSHGLSALTFVSPVPFCDRSRISFGLDQFGSGAGEVDVYPNDKPPKSHRIEVCSLPYLGSPA